VIEDVVFVMHWPSNIEKDGSFGNTSDIDSQFASLSPEIFVVSSVPASKF
jgi:hypothetical protein